MEGRVGDLEGSDCECKLRYSLLHCSQRQFGLDNAYLALTQNDPLAPQISRSTARATGNGPITAEESEDLYLANIIMSDQGNRHILVEASITLGEDRHMAVMSCRPSSLRSATAPHSTKRLPMG